jgi:endoglucanase
MEITSLPTASGREDLVVAWIARWVAARRNLVLTRDRAGNLFVRQKPGPASRDGAARRRPAPLLITAHLDHPAFVVTRAHGGDVELEFRGGVHDPYFERARIEIIDSTGRAHSAQLTALNRKALPFKVATARLDEGAGPVASGDIGRWALAGDGPLPRIADGQLYARACDDLAGVAAALAALDVLRRKKGMDHVGLLFTRAEEVGFIGAIAACKGRRIPKRARLICLETSRSFTESPIGGGPIVRVGDRMSVFEPALTNAISMVMFEHEQARPGFIWQRRLMPGGTCEATAFSSYGYRSTCLCLPLGNYHNMVDIDGVAAGARPAAIGPEYISVGDFHGLVEMLVVCATELDSGKRPSLRGHMEALMKSRGHVLG